MKHSVQLMPLASIKSAAKNPKKHDLDEITESFKRLGFGEPPLLDERTKRLVAGHGRVEALRGLKAKKLMPPLGVHVHGKDWLVPVVRGWRSKNDAAAEAYLVGSNHLVEIGGWDDAALAKMLAGLSKTGQLGGTGWDADGVAKMVAAAGTVGEERTIKISKRPWVKRGQMFQLGRHRVLCGDSTSEADIARAFGTHQRAICVTDPPYGVGLKYADFDDTEANLAALAKAWFPLASARCDVLVFTPGITRQWMYPLPAWVMCWFYGGGQLRSPWGFNCWQPILCYGKDPSLGGGEGARPDAVNLNVPANVVSDHPCPKPVALWEWLFDRLRVRAKTVVFDPFLGSGTSVIAAESVDATCVGIEMTPGYVQGTIERWEKLTGEKHRRLT